MPAAVAATFVIITTCIVIRATIMCMYILYTVLLRVGTLHFT